MRVTKLGGPRVLTVGTFDLLHHGHLDLLERCRKLAGPGGSVIVGVNPDEWVATYKRPPVQSLQTRLGLLRALDRRYADASVRASGASLLPMLELWAPDFLAVGSDWEGRDYLAQIGVTQEELDSFGCRLVYLYRPADGPSTTRIRERLEGK